MIRNQTKSITPELFVKFSQLIHEKLGLDFPDVERNNLSLKLDSLAEAFGFEDINECIKWLTSTDFNPEKIAILAKHLTIGETYFFRDPHLFQTLEHQILPELIRQRRGKNQKIRIWSAACCTGEEAYSMAILLRRLLPDIAEWDITILGSDININFLEKAEKGIYNLWSFRNTPESLRSEYFTKIKENQYRISPMIRSAVKFIYLNLVEEKYPSIMNGTYAMDLILCNNVLIYFKLDKIQQTVKQLTSALIEDGWLMVSPIETPYICDERLSAHLMDGLIYFQKKPPKIPTSEAIQESRKIDQAFEIANPYLPKALQKQTPLSIQNIEYYHHLFKQGSYQEMIEELEKLNQEEYQTPHRFLLAQAYANIGNLERAEYWVKKGLLSDKLNPKSHFLQASILQEMGRFDESVQALKKALFLDPGFIIAFYTLGNLMLRKGCSKEADKYFRNALQLLSHLKSDQELDCAEGMLVGDLTEIILSTSHLQPNGNKQQGI